MAYIDTIHEVDAEGKLEALYQRYGNADGTVDQVLKVHSINPESLEAHAQLYVQAMHRDSPLSRAEREIIGVVVSRLNGCDYCLKHHSVGLRRLLPEEQTKVVDQLIEGDDSGLDMRGQALSAFAEKLTNEPSGMNRHDVDMLRATGMEDREILDAAQAAAYFAYVNRIALALGAELEDERSLGQWPTN